MKVALQLPFFFEISGEVYKSNFIQSSYLLGSMDY